MGGSNYDYDVHQSKVDYHQQTNTSAFVHTANIQSGAVATGVHPSLDPAGKNQAGIKIRESKDSDVHPNSKAVAVLCDETGSMGTLPKRAFAEFPKLMALLVKEGYLPNPHILFGGIGDCRSDEVPLQIGQFEGGNEIDEAVTNIYLEGNGGGNGGEDYALAMFFLARYSQLDCLDKRGEKGYLFITGDEQVHPLVRVEDVKKYIGDAIPEDIPFLSIKGPDGNVIKQGILDELRQKFEVFWIFPVEASYYTERGHVKKLEDIFGDHFLHLESMNDICALIGATIGRYEGVDHDQISDNLVDAGFSRDTANRCALQVMSKGSAITKAAKVDGNLQTTNQQDSITRL